MSDANVEPEATKPAQPGVVGIKSKPTKALPTDRMSFEKQLRVLRAYPAASGPEQVATSNAEVGKVADIPPTSVSMVNEFMVECGLLVREGLKQRPTQALFDYLSAWEWNQETAGLKLAPAFGTMWFAKALLPKLALRQMTRDEAITYLADEAKASKDYKGQLDLLIDYLAVAGLIVVDGNTVSKSASKREEEAPPPSQIEKNQSRHENEPDPSDVERFSIPLPGKPSATIIVPKGLDADDWDMLNSMMATYIKRWKKGVIKE